MWNLNVRLIKKQNPDMLTTELLQKGDKPVPERKENAPLPDQLLLQIQFLIPERNI